MKRNKMIILTALVLVGVFAVASVAYAAVWSSRYSNYDLRRSSTKSVYKLYMQTDLHYNGFNPGIIDGIMGGDTERAVQRFQDDRRLTADGIVGPKTKDRLWEVKAPGGYR